ncbi:MAG TPA: hypothetical protein VFU06_08585 [Longimicrobiales bacterium]|nr:hypothetical protein [Longimicrobiales bacterium]
MKHARAVLLPLGLLAAPLQVPAQDSHIILPIPDLEARLRDGPLQVVDWRGSRAEGDRTQRVVLMYEDSTILAVKWARAAPGAAAFNNEPRYEVAAYELQKLFLGPDEYVVPPTILRAVPRDWLREYDETALATFDGTSSVLVVLQYWLFNVTNEKFWDEDRFRQDSVYARHLANMNVLTYLIRHADENVGNFLIGLDSARPRLFSVDNGVAFRSDPSNRGTAWRNLQVDRLPHATVARLRAITRDDLDRALGVLATFGITGGMLIPMGPSPNLDERRGVRRNDEYVQLGLTRSEIDDVHERLRELLERIDSGRIRTF